MELRIRDGGSLKAASRALRTHASGPAIRREVVKAIKTEMRPLEQKVKAAYRAGPSRAGTNRLRPALARATRSEVRTSGQAAGARIRVSGTRMPSGLGSLPRYWEGEKPWRHPTYGRDPWVTQGAHPTFYRIVRPWGAIIGRRMEQAASEILQRAAKG